MNVRSKKGLKPQHYLLLGALAVVIVMMIIARIPGGTSEPIALPTNWLEVIKPEDLVDFGVVPQEKQTFKLEAGKVAQLTLEPGQTISIAPQKGALRVAYVVLIIGDFHSAGIFDPQKNQSFSMLVSNERRLIYVMGEFFTPTEFEVGPVSLELAP